MLVSPAWGCHSQSGLLGVLAPVILPSTKSYNGSRMHLARSIPEKYCVWSLIYASSSCCAVLSTNTTLEPCPIQQQSGTRSRRAITVLLPASRKSGIGFPYFSPVTVGRLSTKNLVFVSLFLLITPRRYSFRAVRGYAPSKIDALLLCKPKPVLSQGLRFYSFLLCGQASHT